MKKVLWVFLLAAAATGAAAGAPPGYGISSWAGWKPGQISRADCPELRSVPLILKWNSLETAPGRYAFDAELGQPLRAAHADGLYLTLMIWVGPAAPEWVYQQGVPRVITDRKVNALGQKTDGQKEYPYYLHPEYRKRFSELIDAFGKYVTALPAELRARIVFVQCAEGSTGDGQPYKGNPFDPKYAISEEVWNEFRLEAWQRYRHAVPGIPILVNSDANGGAETEWLLEHMDVIALKQGMFSHGFQVSDNGARLALLDAVESAAKKRGKPVLTRGEMDGELFEMGWSKHNIPQALYWSGIFATHCRLDIWNVPHQALKDRANWPAAAFFNKYAGHKDPATAPAAFCALRDGLDASDFNRFPAAQFGGKPGQKKEVERYLRIAQAYAAYGARMDDPEKATGGGMLNRKSKGANDVGWDMLPGNYARFLTQIDPGSGDVGRWNIDESIYGRFGRAFAHQSGKKQMRFRLDPAFAARELKVSVTYLDQGTGSWSIGLPGQASATRIQNANSGKWRTQAVTLPRFAELVLSYEAGDDTVFHLLEVERAASPAVHKLPPALQSKVQFLNPEYLVYTPSGSSKEKRPLLIFLHGGGGVGEDIHRIKGKPSEIWAGIDKFGQGPCLVVAPQCLKSARGERGIWTPEDLNLLLEHLKATLPVDERRIYLTGISMGGYGTWAWAAHDPQHFAAIAPIVGGIGREGPKDVTPDFDQWARNLAKVPVHAFVGALDKTVPPERSERMIAAIQKAGGKEAKLKVYPDEGHGAARVVLATPEFYDWLFAKKRN